jgi:MoaF-like
LADSFPAVGHKYAVEFRSDNGDGQFRVQLEFHSLTSLTYRGIRPDGSLSSSSETVNITVEPIRDLLFLVTWKEQQGTTVVHLEDYKNNTIITNITSPTPEQDNPDFVKFHGTMTQVA